jgi:hypothetical protein
MAGWVAGVALDPAKQRGRLADKNSLQQSGEITVKDLI